MQTIDPSDIAVRLQTIIAELGEFFLEREGVLRNVVLALLTRQHVFLLGPVGSGKTNLLEDLMERINGAEFFAVQLHEQMGREEMFGPIDVPRFSADAVWERDTDGYLPTAHLAMIDELDKGGPGVVRPLLRVINERKFRNGKVDTDLPLMTVVASANEMLPASEVAVWDRFLLRDEVNYLAEADNFVRLLHPSHDGWNLLDTFINVGDLMNAQDAVKNVVVPDPIFEAMLQVRASLAAKGVVASDRRWRASVSVLQASAWLEGRAEVTPADLGVLESILWQTVEHRTQVSEAVLKVGSQGQKDLSRALLMIDSVADTLKARAGQSAADLGDYLPDGADVLRKAEAKLDGAVGEVPQYRLAQARKLWRDTRIQLLMNCAGLTRSEAEEDVA